VTAASNCRSAPAGYSAGSVRRPMRSSLAADNAVRRAAIASGLSSSTAIVTRSAPQARIMTCAPSTTSPARSRMSASSQQIHGSHSAPFSTRCSTDCSRAAISFAAVGNAAPPSPTIPASRIPSIRPDDDSDCQGTGSTGRSHASEPSFSITMQRPRPTGVGMSRRPMSRTIPATGECTAAEAGSPGRAIAVPTRTGMPG
jgi:hypothetical protein